MYFKYGYANVVNIDDIINILDDNFSLREGHMNNKKFLIFCLVCSLILPFVTTMYLFKKVSVIGIIALIFNIIAVVLILICFILERRK